MAVTGLNSYKDSVYQWQAQQLKATGKSSSSSNSAASILLSNQSMTSQISSLVELTKYAMDAMGVNSGNSRVTFSQITKYRNQLQSEFTQSVKAGFAQSGIKNIDDLSFSLDKNGQISVIGANESDRKMAQAWLDANPAFGKELRSSLDNANIEGDVNFTISASGKISVTNPTQKSFQAALDGKTSLTDDLRKALKEMGITQNEAINFSFIDDKLQATGENAEKINSWLAENGDLEKIIREQIQKSGVDESAVTLRLGTSGNIQVSINNAELNDAQKALDDAAATGSKIRAGLSNLGIDANASFTMQVNDDGSVTIISDHPDAAKIQAFFDANPDLVKKYRQIETLAGIDDARKAMQISPTEMRKRIQIESMMSWWAGSNDAASYFGNYNSGSLSLFSGLNMNV